MSIRIRQLILSLLLMAPLILSSCSEDPVNEAYDDDAVRVLVYRAMYEMLPLDTLGCTAMAVGQGDSLQDGFFWPRVLTPHSSSLKQTLASALPLRIVDMHDVSMVSQPDGYPMYRTTDTDEPAVACFTMGIERVDGTHLIVACGMTHRENFFAYGACDLAFEGGAWQARSMNVYYSYRR